MILSNKSMQLLKEAESVGQQGLRQLCAAIAAGKLTVEDAGTIALKLRLAAKDVDRVNGRIFYAKAKRGKKKR